MELNLHTFVLSIPYPQLNATQNSISSCLPLPSSHPVPVPQVCFHDFWLVYECMYKVIGLSVSCAQRPAPVRTRCTTRLNPENNRCVRNVPVPSSIDRFIAEAQYHSLSRSAIFAAAAAERARNNFNGGGIFTTSGGRNFANEMRDYPGIIVIRRSLAQRLECACANSWSDRQSGPTVIFAGDH